MSKEGDCMGKEPFIKTTDEETANKLIKLGFSLITSLNGVYIFANDSVTTFDRNDKVEFTNIMYG
jgi:hypothetical protein